MAGTGDARTYGTDQEDFWAGAFGDAYTDRIVSDVGTAANTALFARILQRTAHVRSVIEFGANAGLNLRAIDGLRPDIDLAGVEINPLAARLLREWGRCEVTETSILEFEPDGTYDLALVKGVLIHISPERLEAVYDRLVRVSSRYVVVAEYYNPTPVAVGYRGHEERLFKRDFAGELMDRHGLQLIDYGFVYHRDSNFPQDDLTWFLLEKPDH